MSSKAKKSAGKKRKEKPSEKPAKKSAPPAHFFASSSETAADDGQQLHSPWLPLIWMLIPLIACVAYGLATRNGAH
jgi:hypothetical protein